MASRTVCRSRAPGQPDSVPPRRPTTDDDNPAGDSASVRTRRIREFAREVLGFDGVPARPGGGDAGGRRRPRHPRRPAVRRREDGDLPGRGPAARRPGRRRLAADRPAARPGRAAGRDRGPRRPGRPAELDACRAGDQREVLEALGGRNGPLRLPRARAADQARGRRRRPRGRGRRCSSSTRRTASRRGATTSAPTTCGWAASSSSSATRRCWPSPPPPHRRSAPRSSSGWRCATPRSSSPGSTGPEIRLEVDHYADAYGKEQGVLDRVLAEIGEGRGPGIVYSATRKGTEEVADAARRPRPARPAVPRRPEQGRARGHPAGLDGRRARRRRRHHRVRHGHRQAGHPLRRPRRARRLPGQLLPGDRPGRPGRRAGPRRAGLPPGGPRAAPLLRRRHPGRGGAPAGRRPGGGRRGRGHRGGRRRQGPARGDRPGGHPAGPRPEPARAGRRPSSWTRTAPRTRPTTPRRPARPPRPRASWPSTTSGSTRAASR